MRGRRAARGPRPGPHRRLPTRGCAGATGSRHRGRAVLELLGQPGADTGAGALGLAPVHPHRGGDAAARADRHPRSDAARSRAPVRARRQLGPAALDAAGRTDPRVAAGGTPGARVELGGHARVRAVGARQQRTRQPSAGQPAGARTVHARAVHVVRALPGRAARPARTHGRAPAAVHRQLERTRARARCQAPARGARARGDGRARPPGGAAGAHAPPARAPEHARAAVAGARLWARARGTSRGSERTEEAVQ